MKSYPIAVVCPAVMHARGILPLQWIVVVYVGNMLENWLDSCVLLWHSKDVAAVNAVFFTCVIGLNAFGLAVTCALGSVFRAVLLTTRTALVCPLPLLLQPGLHQPVPYAFAHTKTDQAILAGGTQAHSCKRDA